MGTSERACPDDGGCDGPPVGRRAEIVCLERLEAITRHDRPLLAGCGRCPVPPPEPKVPRCNRGWRMKFYSPPESASLPKHDSSSQ
jgi:hypothetical protein